VLHLDVLLQIAGLVEGALTAVAFVAILAVQRVPAVLRV